MVTAYKSADGVKNATANYRLKTATITYDSGLTNPETLMKVLSGSPYTARKFDTEAAGENK